jgi:hypothetical protein
MINSAAHIGRLSGVAQPNIAPFISSETIAIAHTKRSVVKTGASIPAASCVA